MKKHERGAAVIVALLIMTLAASTAAFAIWQQSLWVRQLENISDRANADQLAATAIDLARDALKKDTNRNVDNLEEEWAQSLTFSVDSATVSGEIVDQHGLFNLNNLVKNGEPNAKAIQVFQQLLESLKLSPDLANAVADWIKDDQTGSADLEYLALNPPYRAAQRYLTDVAELARIKGFNEDIVRALTPYVTALGKETTVNVNTAKVEVLAALFNDPNVAKAIVNKRDSKPFNKMEEVQQMLPPNTTCPLTNCYDVKSEYFTARVRVKSGRVESGYVALLDRGAGQWPSIIWRKDAAD